MSGYVESLRKLQKRVHRDSHSTGPCRGERPRSLQAPRTRSEPLLCRARVRGQTCGSIQRLRGIIQSRSSLAIWPGLNVCKVLGWSCPAKFQHYCPVPKFSCPLGRRWARMRWSLGGQGLPQCVCLLANFVSLGCTGSDGRAVEPRLGHRCVEAIRAFTHELLGEMREFISLELVLGELGCE